MIAYLYGGPRNGERFEVADYTREIYVAERLELEAVWLTEEELTIYGWPRAGVYRRSPWSTHEFYWRGWK